MKTTIKHRVIGAQYIAFQCMEYTVNVYVLFVVYERKVIASTVPALLKIFARLSYKNSPMAKEIKIRR